MRSMKPKEIATRVNRILALTCLVGVGFSALAQDFPTRPIRWVLGSLAGSGPDTSVRLMQEQISSILGKPVIVDNRSGASGALAISEVRRAPPDGHTLLGVDAGHWAISPALRSEPPNDFLRDFAPVALVYSTPLYIVVPEPLGVKDLRQLIALIRSKPGAQQYGSGGTGSANHLMFESFRASLGLEILHVPYKGSVEFIPALLRGDIITAMPGLPSILPHAKSGQIRILAGSGRTRSRLAPDIPAIAEAGGPPDYDLTARFAVVALAGTPKSAIDKIAQAISKVQAIPEIAARALTLGYELTPAGPESLTEIMRDEIRIYGSAVKAAGIAAGR